MTMKSPIKFLKNTTSIEGISLLRYFANAPVTANIKQAKSI